LILQLDCSSEEYSKALSTIKIGDTFKSTTNNRHFNSDNLLIPYINESSIILDIGASSGITSLDLIQKVNWKFSKYFITDLNLELYYKLNDNCTYFFDLNKKCILMVFDSFVIYPQESIFINKFFGNKISNALKKGDLKRLKLIDPKVKKLIGNNDKIEILEHNIFKPWLATKPNIIKAANLLNLTYFTKGQIIDALNNIFNTLPENGYLLIVENRATEKGALFNKRNISFELISKTGFELDIFDIVLAINGK
jgi:hypothetical protein